MKASENFSLLSACYEDKIGSSVFDYENLKKLNKITKIIPKFMRSVMIHNGDIMKIHLQ